MKTTISASLFALLAVLFASCNLFDPTEPIPSYVYIPSFDFQTNYSTEFTASERFTEVWVFADDELMGVYDLPAEVPILKEGNAQIRIQPGIKNNGITSSRVIYPFIEEHVEWVDLQPNVNDTIIPVFRYRENVTIINVDDFENGTVFAVRSGSQGSITRITNDDKVFEGEGSGLGFLSSEEDILSVVSNEQQYDLPTIRQSWLEMNYKCDNSMSIGVTAVNQQTTEDQYIIILNPTTDDNGIAQWNKIYIELFPTLSTFTNAAHFEINMQSIRDDGNTDDIAVYLDNLKIVHF